MSSDREDTGKQKVTGKLQYRPAKVEMRPLHVRTQDITQDVNRHVGARIRERRIMLGLTQQEMAELIGVAYQQVAQRYENGTSRIAAGKLYTIAKMLGVDVGYFFEGITFGGSEIMSPEQKMLAELARNFADLPRQEYRELVLSLARALRACERGDEKIE